MMDKETWQTIEPLFHEALDLPGDQRADFVRSATVDRPHLQSMVFELLASHEDSATFMKNESAASWAVAIDKVADHLQAQSRGSGKSQTAESQYGKSEPDPDEQQLIDLLESAEPDLQVKNVINRGGMGSVFLAHQKELGRVVAVKVISRASIDRETRSRFVQEARAISQVVDDHVVKIFQAGLEQSIPFLVMEYIDGPSLRNYLKKKQQLEPNEAAGLARQIAKGLQATHQQNLIHRDVKPANVLLENRQESDRSGQPGYRAKLADFGLALESENQLQSRDKLFAGTLAYMSPEQVTKPKDVDHRSDIYGLGITLYQMLTGELPFRGATHMVIRKIQTSEPVSPRKLDDRLPRDIESICLKAVAKDPNARYQSAKEMIEDLERFLENRPTLARPLSSWEKAIRWTRRNPKIAWIATLATALLISISAGSLLVAWTANSKNKEIQRQRAMNVDSRVRRIVDAQPGALQLAIDEVDCKPEVAISKLLAISGSNGANFGEQLNAWVGASILGDPQTNQILQSIDDVYVSPEVCRNLVEALRQDPESVDLLIGTLNETVGRTAKAKRILLLAFLGELNPWVDATNEKVDPSLSTEIVHLLADWHGDLVSLSNQITAADEPLLKSAFCQSLWLTDRRSLNASVIQSVADVVKSWIHNAMDYAVFANAEKLLLKWNPNQALDVNLINSNQETANWYVLDNGIRMVKVLPGTAVMGRLETIKKFEGFPPHKVTITRPYYVSDAEVSVAQFNEFVKDTAEQNGSGSNGDWNPDSVTSPTAEHPAQRVSWYQCARYCNWLSHKHGLQPVYSTKGEVRRLDLPNGNWFEYEVWVSDLEANGFRLPTEHEFALACRSGSETKNYFGVQSELFKYYSISSSFTAIPASPVRSYLPNRIGLFDTVGNVWEWTNDWCSHIDESPMTDPVGPSGPTIQEPGRVYRSGGVSTGSGETDAEARGAGHPAMQAGNVGFRIARSAE